MDLVYIFGWDIDFIFDIRSGDSFEILYEEYFFKGEKIKNGNSQKEIFANSFIKPSTSVKTVRGFLSPVS